MTTSYKTKQLIQILISMEVKSIQMSMVYEKCDNGQNRDCNYKVLQRKKKDMTPKEIHVDII